MVSGILLQDRIRRTAAQPITISSPSALYWAESRSPSPASLSRLSLSPSLRLVLGCSPSHGPRRVWAWTLCGASSPNRLSLGRRRLRCELPSLGHQRVTRASSCPPAALHSSSPSLAGCAAPPLPRLRQAAPPLLFPGSDRPLRPSSSPAPIGRSSPPLPRLRRAMPPPHLPPCPAHKMLSQHGLRR